MTNNEAKPDSNISQKSQSLIEKAPVVLEKLSLLFLIIVCIVPVFDIILLRGQLFFLFTFPLLVLLPIASLFAILVQIYMTVKKHPATSRRVQIFAFSIITLLTSGMCWGLAYMQSNH